MNKKTLGIVSFIIGIIIIPISWKFAEYQQYLNLAGIILVIYGISSTYSFVKKLITKYSNTKKRKTTNEKFIISAGSLVLGIIILTKITHLPPPISLLGIPAVFMILYGIFTTPIYLVRVLYKDNADEINGYIAYFILIMGGVVGYFVYFFNSENNLLEENGKTTITQIKSYDYKKYYEIEVNGENYKSSYFDTDSLFVGDKVIVRYYIENPNNNKIIRRVK